MMNKPMEAKIRVDVASLPNIKCGCGSVIFTEAFELKKLSALQSPSGKEELVPLPVIVCKICGAPLGLTEKP
jgi:hypothetical protein